MTTADTRGWPIPAVPASPALGRRPLEELVARTEEGFEIGPWTAPVWQRDRFDLDYILFWLYDR